MKKPHRHIWQYIGRIAYVKWEQYSHWCQECGTIRRSTYKGGFRYWRVKK